MTKDLSWLGFLAATLVAWRDMLQGVRVKIMQGQGRGSVVLRTAMISVATRGCNVIASLLTVPLVLHHVGHERYGIWMAALAVATLFTMADGGVTKGLVGAVAKAHGADDRPRVRVLIASAMAATLTILMLFLVALFGVVGMVDWTWAFNLSDPALGREAAVVITTICLCYAASFPATVIREARLGLLQGPIVNAWDFAGSVVSFLGLIAAVAFHANLATIAAMWAGGTLLMRTVSAVVFLAGQGRDLTPRWCDVDPAVGRGMIATGSVFMLYTLTQTLSVQSDQVLIARYLGASAVTDYAIVQRLFNQPQVLVTLGLIAQWPGYGEALGRGDNAWIRHHFSKSVIGYAAFAVLSCGLLALLCHAILYAWVGGTVTAPTSLIIAMAINGVVSTVANVFAFFFLSLGMLRRTVAAQMIMLAVSLPLSLLLLPQWGPVGAVIASTLGNLLAYIVPGVMGFNRMFADLHASNPTALVAA